ncbi:DNA-processing protein DprA [Apilactobacillus xinyiensis]|uniref:DNA-processing protein DprA n=1 Tax=Apilactobacillus xinyiensis TaxID=2841032 RepID=UPI001C7DCFB3|nr:DNA-processing protein DprA [Apilactobacillus xinyiensis]MCL0318163.1 DNA-processing protein DprA [Apilactobacillus xinyiensis]
MNIEKIKLLLLKLRISKGIGISGEHKFYQWMHKNQKSVCFEDLNAKIIAQIAQLNVKNAKIFIGDFNSHAMYIRLNKNLKFCKYISIVDTDYPIALKEGYLPPNILFYQGDKQLISHSKLLGVVGSRKHTKYAIQALQIILPDCVRLDFAIVSGLAQGVDKLSHQCTIASGGSTIAVIGTGLDKYYPAENQELQDYISKKHLVMTEYPLDTPTAKFHFPDRNRIIAALVRGVLVVEAKSHSGSLITANLALQNNREVFAIPGRINDIMSKGCNDLILAGAKPVLSFKDIVEEFQY